MSQVIKTGGGLFAVELDWGAVLAAGTVSKALSNEAARRKVKLVATHQVNQQLRGLTADTDLYGFFMGNAPRGKLYSLASAFARATVEKESILALALDAERVLMVGVKNGRPISDALVSYDKAPEIARQYKMNDAPGGALLYLLGDWSAHPQEGVAITQEFSSVHAGELDLLSRPDEVTRLRSANAGMSMGRLVTFAAIAMFAYIVLDTFVWPDEQPAAAAEVNPDVAYAQSRDQALMARPVWKAAGLVDALVREIGKEPVEMSGWSVSGLTCVFPKGVPAKPDAASIDVPCTTSWAPDTGAMDDLAKSMPGISFSVKNGVASGDISKSYRLPAALATMDAEKLQVFQDVLVKVGSDFKRMSDGGIVTADLRPTALIGTIPTSNQGGKSGAVALTKPALEAGEWSMTGPLGFTSATKGLPDSFSLSEVTISVDATKDSFAVKGSYFVRHQ